MTDRRLDARIIFAVAETGSYLDGKQNKRLEQKFNCCSKKWLTNNCEYDNIFIAVASGKNDDRK